MIKKVVQNIKVGSLESEVLKGTTVFKVTNVATSDYFFFQFYHCLIFFLKKYCR